MDAISSEEGDVGEGVAANEERGDGEGFDKHEAWIPYISLFVGTHTLSQLSSTDRTPQPLSSLHATTSGSLVHLQVEQVRNSETEFEIWECGWKVDYAGCSSAFLFLSPLDYRTPMV